MINPPLKEEENKPFSEFYTHLDNIINKFSNTGKYAILVLVDLCLFAGSIVAAIALAGGSELVPAHLWHLGKVVLLAIGLKIGFFGFFRIYQQILQYTSWEFIITIIKAICASCLTLAAIDLLLLGNTLPVGVWVSDGIISLSLTIAWRLGIRLLRSQTIARQDAAAKTSKVIIYGAGSNGRIIAQAVIKESGKKLIGFVDDDPHLQGRNVRGIRVYAPAELLKLKASIGFDEILLSMKSIDSNRQRDLTQKLQILGVPVKTVPSFSQILNNRIPTEKAPAIDIEDLLGRKAIAARPELLQHDLKDRVVLVTGGGGSIGSELCRQIAKQQPKMLLVYELNEFALYQMDMELTENYPQLKKLACLGSVTDPQNLKRVLTKYRVDIIYHAAAYKHVPIVEANPISGMINNISGTLTAAKCAIECGVPKFVLISTDKAVRPTNIMGATKRVAELVLQGLADVTAHDTCFTMVRFGNVLGSSGSVVPRFCAQIAAGQPISLTHADITRYFMTIPEAATLVIQAGAMAKGGEVFLLDMGEPVKIYDLAAQLIRLHGLEPERDVKIEVTGLRPGEKIYEELLIDCDAAVATGHPKIFCAREVKLAWQELEPKLESLLTFAADSDVNECVAVLHELVPEYQPMGQYAKAKSDAVAVSMAMSISSKLRKSEIHYEGRKYVANSSAHGKIVA